MDMKMKIYLDMKMVNILPLGNQVQLLIWKMFKDLCLVGSVQDFGFIESILIQLNLIIVLLFLVGNVLQSNCLIVMSIL